MNAIIILIILCEIGFWIFIAAGLIARYVFKLPKVGLILLSATPLIDLVLLAATSFDLARGATATIAHAIAAVYIGVSLAYGKSMIRWADQRFAYYIIKQGEKPKKLYGKEHALKEVKGWLQHVLAYIIGAGLLFAVIFWIDDAERTAALTSVLRIWSIVLGIDFLISFSYILFPKKEKHAGS
ncbi:hypothetical protein SAMN05421663_10610 [Terribacillus halophilus]|uniref:Membrane protein YmcC n=1 Tax=Terribacillus halophilus TaxID=361279 RepID=A0A1G6RDE9_9BACI|nr:hypothetical protein [Terribacillus halophilus]SDD02085.1 hypothetical protein SAMN05421663_10610 [Terribacillus halophilus]